MLGLTGWIQINGRDELEINVKVKLDGEYIVKMRFSLDGKCFFSIIIAILKHDGAVVGGTSAIKEEYVGNTDTDDAI